ILSNLSANLLGLGNAATPMGIRAMQELQKLNPDPYTATPAMCTLLALNTASITLVPTTLIAIRLQFGSQNPAEIIGSTLLATAIATGAAIAADRWYRKKSGAPPYSADTGGKGSASSTARANYRIQDEPAVCRGTAGCAGSERTTGRAEASGRG